MWRIILVGLVGCAGTPGSVSVEASSDVRDAMTAQDAATPEPDRVSPDFGGSDAGVAETSRESQADVLGADAPDAPDALTPDVGSDVAIDVGVDAARPTVDSGPDVLPGLSPGGNTCPLSGGSLNCGAGSFQIVFGGLGYKCSTVIPNCPSGHQCLGVVGGVQETAVCP